MNELKINNYIDWREMWKYAVKTHLEDIPTIRDYKDYLEILVSDVSFAEEMYAWLDKERLKRLGEMGLNSDEDEDYIISVKNHHSDKEILFIFSESEDRSTEGGYDESGIEITFTYHTGYNLFTDFSYEQW